MGLIDLYRLMALARALDERAWVLNRSGRVHFVISGQGHEGAEAGITAALTPGRDWLLPYYRSMTGVGFHHFLMPRSSATRLAPR